MVTNYTIYNAALDRLVIGAGRSLAEHPVTGDVASALSEELRAQDEMTLDKTLGLLACAVVRLAKGTPR